MALTGSTNEEKIWNYLYEKIGNAKGVAAMCGNIQAESGCNPKNMQDSYESKLGYNDDTYTAAVDNGTYKNFATDGVGYSLVQFTWSPRKKGYLEYAQSKGASVGDLETCLEYIWIELQGDYSSVLSALKSATDITAASNVVLKDYEAPADQGSSVQATRASYSQAFYDKYYTGGTDMATSSSSSKGVSSDTAIAIAKEEIGYLEKATNSDLDSKTGNAGYNNYTKYWRDLYEWTGQNYQGQAWCAAFVMWCFCKAYGLSTAQSLLLQTCYINCQTMYTLATNAGQLYTSPAVGDIVLFYTSSSGQYGHTGIVIETTSNGFVTIEGNTSSGSTVVANGGGVYQKQYVTSNLTKPRFMRPKYTSASSSSTGSIGSGTTGSTGSSGGTTLNTTVKEYGVTNAKAPVRTYAGTSYSECSFSPLAKGTTVGICDTLKSDSGAKWYYILYNGKYGFTKATKIDVETASSGTSVSYMVKVSISDLNIRSGPGVNYATIGKYTGVGTFTIVKESSGQGSTKGWGLLKSYQADENGWISLDYATKVS